MTGLIWWAFVFTSPWVRLSTLGGWNPVAVVVFDMVLFVGCSAAAATTGRWRWGMVVAVWSVLMLAGLVGQSVLVSPVPWGVIAMLAATTGSLFAALILREGRFPSEMFLVGPLRFRSAPQRTPLRQLLRSLRYMVVFWFTFLVAIPAALVWAEKWLGVHVSLFDATPAVAWVGVAILVVGSALGLWSCFTMALTGDGTPLPNDTARRLVVAGPYRWVRNPMAVAGVVQTVGVALIVHSWTVLIGAFAGAVVWHVVVRPAEELDLLGRFGGECEEYRNNVRCWVPTGTRSEQ